MQGILIIVLIFAICMVLYFATKKKEHYPPDANINAQYSNPVLSVREKHPVLAFQQMHDEGINPANVGDPIRIPNTVNGPMGLYGEPSRFVDSLRYSFGSIPVPPPGENENFGPAPGKPLGIPVPMGALKQTNEYYNPDMFRFSPLAAGTIATALRPPLINGVPLPTPLPPSNSQVTVPGADFPYQMKPVASGDFFRPYGPNVPVSNVPFFGNVNAYAPFPEINTPWEKAGLLTTTGDEKNEILNLYRRPIAPLQDLWEYQVQDKNGFVIKLENIKYLENGDVIQHILGKNGLGPWKVTIFVQNKYIWV